MAAQSSWIINKREASARDGMVTSMHPLASDAGAEMLRAGGNAMDAAVAAAFAIGVVEPFMSGLGGICALVSYDAATGKTWNIDGSTTAPLQARDDMFELTDGVAGMYGWPATRGDEQNTGYRSPCVPGTPAALLLALDKFGTLPRSRVLAPAIRLAEQGFALDWYVAGFFAFAARRLNAFPSTRQTYLADDGTPLPPYTQTEPLEPFCQPGLARSLKMLADAGADAFYRGEIAHTMVHYLRANGGVLSETDLAEYQPRLREGGLESTYRGVRLVGMPETAGCITAYQALNILECFDISSFPAGSAEAYHLLAEAQRRAFVDRFEHLADPAFTEVPWEGLMSKDYARHLAGTIDLVQANTELTPGDPWAYQSERVRGDRGVTSVGADSTCTTHITVIDSQRNMVALTSTLGAEFGCGVVAGDTGILLNNGMTWFDPVPGHLNSIAPGKRTLIAPTPTLAFRDGQPWLAVGAPGGRKIMSAVMQALVNVIDFGEGIQDAVSSPRVHSEDGITLVSDRIDPSVSAELRVRGHNVDVRAESFGVTHFARPNGILIDQNSGELRGGVNQFTSAWACGVGTDNAV